MVTSKKLTQTQLETKICQISHPEGIGTLYERVVLSRLFKRLLKEYKISSTLEYYAHITKGWDNIALNHFIDQVSIADSNYQRLVDQWPDPDNIPNFSNLRDAPNADLVWNFAIIHHKPNIISRMAQKSNRYVLVFTPNFFNWGWPLHAAFHTLTRTKCTHPESGNRWRRTLIGLKQHLKSQNLNPVKTGYIDMPIWPDFAFSKTELFKAVGKKPSSSHQSKPSPSAIYKNINQHTKRIESQSFAPLVAPIIAHHQYILAQK